MLLNPLRRRVREHLGFPILPGAWPVIGHLPAMVFHLPELLRHAERRMGSHFWLDFGPSGLELTCTQLDAFSLFKNKDTTSVVIGESVPEVLGNTMLAQDGEIHRSIRSCMTKPFQPSGLSAAGVGELFAGMIEHRMKAWLAQGEICLVRDTRELVLSMAFRMLGIEETACVVWSEKFQEFLRLAIAPPIDLPGTPLRRGRRARDWIDSKLQAFIRNVRACPDAGGLLAAVVRSFDDGDGLLNDSHLICNLRFLILGAHDTTAATIAHLTMQLAQQPQLWDALCDEARTVGAVPRNPDELARFPYAEALFRETLRWHPAAPMTKRRALVDLDLGGRTIPAGTNLSVPVFYLSRHPDLYPQPDEFLIERWLNRKESIKPTEMLQFGGGPHFCLGYHVAWMEIVQFAVSLALAMSAKGLRPRLSAGRQAMPRYYPTAYPSSAVRVVFA